MKTPLYILLVTALITMVLTAQDPFEARKQNREDLLKLRETQIGKQFETLTLGERTFQLVKILEINDAGVKISHNSGVGIINWGLIQAEAKTALGFDEIAFSQFLNAEKEKAQKQKEYFNSPKYQAEKAAIAEKTQRMKEDISKRAQQDEMARISAEITQWNLALKNLRDSKLDLEDYYEKEDHKAIKIKKKGDVGGIRTSQADRAKNIASWSEKIRNAEIRLHQLSQELARLKALD
jgi:hypothetical protein